MDHSNTSRQTIVIDCDPGQDDAIAILLALGAHEALDVRAITTVSGNVPVEITQRNACIVRDWAGKTATLPVYAGCSRPLAREPFTAADVHGESGLEGLELHEPLAPVAGQHAVDWLVEMLSAAVPASVTICAIGPLTNIATALLQAPQICASVREIVLMGGAYFQRGNATPVAEFNLYVDPDAAEIVFSSDVPIVVLPRDAAVNAPITPARIAPIRAIGNRCGNVVADLMEAILAFNVWRRGLAEAPMYDPLTIGYLIDPSLFGGRAVNVVIETAGKWTLGETVVDWTGRTGRTINAKWINEVDADSFYTMLCEKIRNLP
jgi:purine nucleosidase